MKTHELKTETGYYKLVKNGTKQFEIRFNDRNFHVGDKLILKEIDEKGQYTGEQATYLVTYLVDDKRFVKDGYVVMQLERW